MVKIGLLSMKDRVIGRERGKLDLKNRAVGQEKKEKLAIEPWGVFLRI